MFRERQLITFTYTAGTTQIQRLPTDSVYHLLQLACYGGSVSSVFGATPTGPAFETNFPFSLIRNMRLIRNGADVVWQGSGAQLAKESYILNNAHPQARIYTTASNVETLLTGTSRGVTIPANAEGIGANLVEFVGSSTASSTVTSAQFDFQMEMWLQMGNTDAPQATLVDARKLATFDLEITWADVSSIIIAGTNNTSNTITATVQVLSVDQDNLSVDEDFGTFKRAALQYSSFQYGSSNNQILLPRGNFFYGQLLATRAYKSGSTVVLRPENSVISTIDNRINSNFSLRKVDFRQLQSKNKSDNGGRQQAYSVAEGGPQGWAAVQYASAMNQAGEMVATYVMDQFDELISIQAIGNATNGATTSSTNPVIDILTQEVIPGVSVAQNAPQGAFAGSSAKTSAKPYAR